MSHDRQVSFFDFENLTDNERQVVEKIISARIDRKKSVQLPWEEKSEGVSGGSFTPLPGHMITLQMMVTPSSHQTVIQPEGLIQSLPSEMMDIQPRCSYCSIGTHPQSKNVFCAGGFVPFLQTAVQLEGTAMKPVQFDSIPSIGCVEHQPVASSSCLAITNSSSKLPYGSQNAMSSNNSCCLFNSCPAVNSVGPCGVVGFTKVIDQHNNGITMCTEHDSSIHSREHVELEIPKNVQHCAVSDVPETGPPNDELNLSGFASTDVSTFVLTAFEQTDGSSADSVLTSLNASLNTDVQKQKGGVATLNDCSSDDAGLLNIRESSQWPTVGQTFAESSVTSSSPFAPKGKTLTWASLLKDTATAANAIVINSDRQTVSDSKSTGGGKSAHTKDAQHNEFVNLKPLKCVDAVKQRIADLLKSHRLSHRSVHMEPRGLTNRGNWCYVNATLQALLACPPFYHLIRLLPPLHAVPADDRSVAVMKCLLEFVNHFHEKSVKSSEKQNDSGKGLARCEVKSGAPFEPVQVYKMLQLIDYQAFKHGQQEDAEEFLSCILNRLHEEMVAVMKLHDKDKNAALLNGDDKNSLKEQAVITNSNETYDDVSVREEGENRWEQVRSRNRTVFNSLADSESSPISAIFRGQICSILHQLGQKESATLQSFFTLQLDVQNENVKSVKDALEQLVSKESLQGYTCTRSKVEVDATQRLLLEELPPVLVLHLKWFIYDKSGGIQKCVKQVDFDVDLEIGKDLLSSHARTKCPTSHRKYKLFAVVNHIGTRAVGGHYTVDVYHAGYNCWLHCDDSNVSSTTSSAVTKFVAPKVPYLIFYRRLEPS